MSDINWWRIHGAYGWNNWIKQDWTANRLLNVWRAYPRDVKRFIFWNITPCSLVKVNRCLGGKYRLHPQGRRVSQARNKHEAGSKEAMFIWNNFRLVLDKTAHIPEYRTLHNHRCENLKSYIIPKLRGIHQYNTIGFEVLTAVTLKSTIFWDVTSERKNLQAATLKMRAVSSSKTLEYLY
jgi:hypothetical protein